MIAMINATAKRIWIPTIIFAGAILMGGILPTIIWQAGLNGKLG